MLKGDALEVDARLAKTQYDLSVAENGLATQHEHLNQLLARDLETPFRVDFIPEEDTTTLSLEEARQQASRIGLRSARLISRKNKPSTTAALRRPNTYRTLVSRLATWGFRTCRSFRRMSVWPALR